MSDRPGCTHGDCTEPAAYKAIHDDRLTGQWLCFTHAVDDILQATQDLPGEGAEHPMQ